MDLHPFVRRLLRAAWDVAAWLIAIVFVVLTRYDFYLETDQWNWIAVYAALACGSQLVAGAVLKLYLGRYRIGSFDEIIGLITTVVISSFIAGSTFLAIRPISDFPRGIALLAPPLALLLMASARWGYRAWRSRGRIIPDDAEPALVYGAGDAGYQLVRLLKMDAASPFRPVGLIDDDPSKRNLVLTGVPVLGSRDHLSDAARATGATTVIMAISAATPEMIREVSKLAEDSGIKFLILPPVRQMVGGRVSLSDVKELDIADILGRRQVDLDLDSIAGYLTGKRVLVTGAGGSIGSELARQVHRFGPAELALLDRDESALHSVQLSIYGKALLDTQDMVLVSIRDEDSLREVFRAHRPEVVFHAAALKHQPLLELYPEEGWKTNVLGTLNVLRVAEEFGVEQFVNVSTDKAADPVSVLGRTKRIAEQLTSWYGEQAKGTYISVRFGNVLGSRGSMLHTFRGQIEKGGPVTVTHPEITRYFMTIPEAAQLVIQAAAIGNDGEVLVLDMGEPVSILDVAERLIAASGKQVEIVFTGLRPNEKMHEVLLSDQETASRSNHPLISQVPVPPLAPSALDSAHRAELMNGVDTGRRVPENPTTSPEQQTGAIARG
ncbi:polysaccharide biosynthesis protein [Georgenia sp. Z1344]|uniref:polysaccharide biosynthesis protein n=1 Tax=Georgenia sp. Z1344 TaxID=3416706 RepID=UPI003CEF7203